MVEKNDNKRNVSSVVSSSSDRVPDSDGSRSAITVVKPPSITPSQLPLNPTFLQSLYLATARWVNYFVTSSSWWSGFLRSLGRHRKRLTVLDFNRIHYEWFITNRNRFFDTPVPTDDPTVDPLNDEDVQRKLSGYFSPKGAEYPTDARGIKRRFEDLQFALSKLLANKKIKVTIPSGVSIEQILQSYEEAQRLADSRLLSFFHCLINYRAEKVRKAKEEAKRREYLDAKARADAEVERNIVFIEHHAREDKQKLEGRIREIEAAMAQLKSSATKEIARLNDSVTIQQAEFQVRLEQSLSQKKETETKLKSAQDRVQEAQTAIKNLENDKSQLNSQVEKLSQEISQLNSKLEEAQTQSIRDLTRLRNETSEENNKLVKELAAVKAHLEAKTNELDNTQAKLTKTEHELESKTTDLSNKQSSLEEANANLQAATKGLEELKKSHTELIEAHHQELAQLKEKHQQELQDIRQALEDSQQEAASKLGELHELNIKLEARFTSGLDEAAKNQLDTLADLESTRHQLEEAKRLSSSLEQEKAILEHTKLTLDQQKTELESQLFTKDAELATVKRELGDTAQEAYFTEEELNSSRRQLEEAKRHTSSLETQISQLEKQLRYTSNWLQELLGELGITADESFDAQSSLEKARQAITKLTTAQGDSTSEIQRQAKAINDGITALENLQKTAEGLNDELLKSQKTEQELQAALELKDQKLNALSDQLKSSREKSDQISADKSKEINELKTQLSDKQHQLESSHQLETELNEKIESLESKLKEQDEELVLFHAERDSALNSADSLVASIRELSDRLKQQSNSVDDSIAHFSDLLESAAKKLDEAQARITTQAEELSAASDELVKKEVELNKAQTSADDLTRQLEERDRQAASALLTIQQGEAEIKQLSDALASHEKDISDLNSKLVVAEQSSSEETSKRKIAEENLTERTTKLTAAEDSIAKLQKELYAARQAVDAHQRQITELSNKLSENSYLHANNKAHEEALSKLQSTNNDLENRHNELEKQFTALDVDYQTLQQAHTRLLDDDAARSLRLDQVKAQADLYHAQLEENQAVNFNLRRDKEELRKRLDNANKAIRELVDQLNEERRRITELEQRTSLPPQPVVVETVSSKTSAPSTSSDTTSKPSTPESEEADDEDSRPTAIDLRKPSSVVVTLTPQAPESKSPDTTPATPSDGTIHASRRTNPPPPPTTTPIAKPLVTGVSDAQVVAKPATTASGTTSKPSVPPQDNVIPIDTAKKRRWARPITRTDVLIAAASLVIVALSVLIIVRKYAPETAQEELSATNHAAQPSPSTTTIPEQVTMICTHDVGMDDCKWQNTAPCEGFGKGNNPMQPLTYTCSDQTTKVVYTSTQPVDSYPLGAVTVVLKRTGTTEL